MHRNDKKHVLKSAVLATAMVAALLSAPLAASAAGMGKITVLSALGQPLRAELDITASREELASLAARVASVDVFRQANVEYAPVLSSVRFSLDKRPDGKPYFKIHTDRAVNDPFIDFLVELSWSSGRLVREYAFLLDPPELKTDNLAAVVTEPGRQLVVDTTTSVETAVPAEPAQIKKSSPAPVASQKPRAASDVTLPTESESVANTRAVKYGDTLSKIATESVAAGVTLDQMLVALFNSNRDAFIDGNMNRLRAGKILRIPVAEEAAAITASDARKIVVVQFAAFNAYRSSLAAAAASQVPLEQEIQQSSSGKITPKVEEKAAAVSGQDKLQVSRSEGKTRVDKGKISEEDLVARDNALKEANSRIADLEKNLDDLKRLAELKTQAALVKPAETLPSEEKGITVAAPPPAVPAVVATPESQVVSAHAELSAAEKALQTKPKKKVSPPPPQPELNFVEDNPLLVYGGAAALLSALLGFLGFRIWKRKRDAASEESDEGLTVNDLAASSVFGMTSGERVASDADPQPDFGHSTIEVVESGKEHVDPIQEAEVYMAYGRDGQAEEILLEAMRKDPENITVYLKLLEIYAGRKSLPQFNELASELYTRTNGNGSEWANASALGRSLDPSNSLYGGTSALVTEEPEQDVAFGTDSAEMLVDETAITQDAALEDLPDTEPAVLDEIPSALDFDLDSEKSGPAASSDVPEATSSTTQASDLDFDLDTGEGEAPVKDAATEGGLDINFDAPDTADSALDFDFDLGTDTSNETGQVAPPVDLSSINLDLNEPDNVTSESAEIDNAGDSAEVATKLELAHAYEEMGDREGARELLQEVLAEGSPAQQETARNKLAQLG